MSCQPHATDLGLCMNLLLLRLLLLLLLLKVKLLGIVTVGIFPAFLATQPILLAQKIQVSVFPGCSLLTSDLLLICLLWLTRLCVGGRHSGA